MDIISNARLQKIKQVVAARQRDFVLVLEDIFDPHNAAAILRSCDAFGVQQVYFIFEKQLPYDPHKIGKASSSTANKWLSFKIFTTTRDCLKALKEEGYISIATAITEKSQSLEDFEWPEKIALWLGNEHSGLTDAAIKEADRVLYIPMHGMVQSLNVSVSAAVTLYAATEFRRKSTKNYNLTKEGQAELVADFVGR